VHQAIFFTYALILTDFYGVDSADIGFFLIPFALGNFLGSVTIGTLRFCTRLRRTVSHVSPLCAR
jgi:predicted MFS family arabinose efflux permease